jgi:murein DD-endopeptidase MepM/ murein hydrolase activator NlpD
MRKQVGVIVLIGTATVGCAQQKPAPGPAVSASVNVLMRAESAVIESRVPRHATLDSLLRQHRLSTDLVDAAVRSAASVFNPRQLRADRPYRLVLSFDGFLREFQYEIDTDRFLRIISRDRGRPEVLDAEVLPFEKESNIVAVRGGIDADHPSLIAAMGEAGENVQLAMAVADVFGGQIDFNNELQAGDSFEILFEKSTRDGEFAGYGPILGATFVADGKPHHAFRWVNPKSGKAAYYDEEGRSLKRFFLVSPLRFEPRVTSHFSRQRLHPVHNTVRAHTGVDYGAPHGAAVVAVADGTVVSAGWAGAGGNQVRIRHTGGVETFYMHLSGFGPGIRRGVSVGQGQLIGRVGATGTATGPHLHFSLRRNDTFVDPVAERRRQPPGEPIPDSHLDAYRAARDEMLLQIDATLAADESSRVRHGQGRPISSRPIALVGY